MNALPIAGPGETTRAVLALMRRKRGVWILTIVLMLAGSAAALTIPPLLGWIVDIVIDGSALTDVVAAAMLLAGAGAVSAACTWTGGVLLVGGVQSLLADLREQVFASAMTLEASTVEHAGSSDVVSRLTGDVEAVTEAGSGILPRFVGALFTIVLTAGGMALIDPLLALAALCAAPFQVIAVVRFLRRSRPLYVRLRQEVAARGQSIIESVAGADTVRAHGDEQDRLDVIAQRSLTAVETQRSSTCARNVFYGTLNFAEFIGLAAVIVMGWWRVDTDAVTVGAVTAAALYFHRLFDPIGALLTSIDDLQRAQAGLERLVGLLHAAPPERDVRPVVSGEVRLRGVGFAYPRSYSTHPALSAVDLTVPTGTCTVLVGASGSGKSTVARLVAGLASPDAGTVTVGGVGATRAVREDGRPAVVLVTQETHVFSGTLADNLRLARMTASDEDLYAALRAVDATWVTELPHGLNTVLGDDIDDQRLQHLALARVILADPPVVVLDEATAHAGADGALDRAVASAVRGRTAVIVAHRLSHAETADQVVVFEQGRIVEHGAPAELRASDGAYARLWSAWAGRAAPAQMRTQL